jgi:magnesium transporter
MIRSFIFSDGKLVGQDLELEALRLVRADKGLLLWVDLDAPTPEEIKAILEGVFQFHPLAIEDCVQPNSLPKVEDYEDYLFLVTHAVDFTRTEKFNTAELDLFLGKDYLVTFHTAPLRSVTTLIDRLAKNVGLGPRGPDRIAHTLIDLLVDNYAPVIDELRAELEELEEHVLAKESGTEEPRQRTPARPQRLHPAAHHRPPAARRDRPPRPRRQQARSAPSCCPTSATCAITSPASRRPPPATTSAC